MTALATPDRSLAQRMEALLRANSIRTRRADLKRDLKAGRVSFAQVLLDPPEWAQTAKVVDLLQHVPKVGPVKVGQAMRVCRFSAGKTVAGLSDRQRAELIRWLPTLPDGPMGPLPRRQPTGPDPDAQHMRALGSANSTRLAHSAIKRRIAAGEVTVASLLRDAPEEVRSMSISTLLAAQYRWGTQRTVRLLAACRVSHDRTIGNLTQRQRLWIGDLLEYGPASPPPAGPAGAVAVRSRSGRLHLIADTAHIPACGHEGNGYVWVKAEEWTRDDARRCQMCVSSAAKRSLVPHD